MFVFTTILEIKKHPLQPIGAYNPSSARMFSPFFPIIVIYNRTSFQPTWAYHPFPAEAVYQWVVYLQQIRKIK
jgi:hypothetical protein